MKAHTLLSYNFLTTSLSLAMPMPVLEVAANPILFIEYPALSEDNKVEETKEVSNLINTSEESSKFSNEVNIIHNEFEAKKICCVEVSSDNSTCSQVTCSTNSYSL